MFLEAREGRVTWKGAVEGPSRGSGRAAEGGATLLKCHTEICNHPGSFYLPYFVSVEMAQQSLRQTGARYLRRTYEDHSLNRWLASAFSSSSASSSKENDGERIDFGGYQINRAKFSPARRLA